MVLKDEERRKGGKPPDIGLLFFFFNPVLVFYNPEQIDFSDLMKEYELTTRPTPYFENRTFSKRNLKTFVKKVTSKLKTLSLTSWNVVEEVISY